MDESKSGEVSKRGQPNAPNPPDGDTESFAASFWSGPIPDPADFGAYEKIVPGAGKIILGAFTAQGKHRQKMEKKAINAEVFLQGFAMFLGYTITLAVIGVALFLLYNDKQIAGFVTLATVLVERWYATNKKDPRDKK